MVCNTVMPLQLMKQTLNFYSDWYFVCVRVGVWLFDSLESRPGCGAELGWAGLVHVTPGVNFIYWSNIWPEYDSVSDLVLYIGFGCTKCTEEYHCHY